MRPIETKLHALLVSGQAGDNAAYHLFLKELSQHLRAFFKKRMYRLPDEVEDLVQETLLAVHNQRHTYDPGQPLTAWVHAIARYKFADLLRRRNGHEALHDPFDDDMEVFAASAVDASDARRDVARLLAQLPDALRLPLQHVKIDGLSITETAGLTGMSESAVKVGVHRGLKALAAKMKGEP